MNVGNLIALYTVYHTIDDGLANILAVETLRHGTNPVNFISISLWGANPKHGGKKTGSTYKMLDLTPKDTTGNPKGYFHVVKDSDYKVDAINYLWFPACLGKRLLPLLFSTLSGYNLSVYPLDNLSHEKLWVKRARVCIGVAGAILSMFMTPTLKFRYVNPDSFVDDPCAELWAYRTAKKVEAWRIGILGSLITGVNSSWAQRAIAKPWKVLTGFVQISWAVALIVMLARRTFPYE